MTEPCKARRDGLGTKAIVASYLQELALSWGGSRQRREGAPHRHLLLRVFPVTVLYGNGYGNEGAAPPGGRCPRGRLLLGGGGPWGQHQQEGNQHPRQLRPGRERVARGRHQRAR
ncbi:hypothetical protein Pcinc_020520 [Petrolisthes cinctipes]|uniref:Uncharacterized protein n=1 Tax=Petrolisthes cinctipes TaxID=88211 RepID=A0AAE1FIZ5_PETCI|nr:hypothetical protein Pcinc_020520 [Petrolisthes cinctipes]